MTDLHEAPGGLEPEEGSASEERFPWDEDPSAPNDPDAPRQRHDAFNGARKVAFLNALVKTGCIRDACRQAGIAPRTVYRHQEGDPDFFEHCRLALRMSGTPIELTAWQRAVEGVEQEFACGGQVHVRRRYDAGLLRLLLQGSNPKKYGPRPGFGHKRLLKHERRQMEREIRAEIAAREASAEEVTRQLGKRLQAFGVRTIREMLEKGWTRSPGGDWVPPGYAPIPGWEDPGESV